MRRLQQRLGGNAPHIQAGSAEGAAHFDTGGFEAQLSGFDGGDVAAGTAADDDYVILGEGRGGGEPGGAGFG